MTEEKCPVCGDAYIKYHEGSTRDIKEIRSDATTCIKVEETAIKKVWVHLPEDQKSMSGGLVNDTGE